jgi:hypothetical protein
MSPFFIHSNLQKDKTNHHYDLQEFVGFDMSYVFSILGFCRWNVNVDGLSTSGHSKGITLDAGNDGRRSYKKSAALRWNTPRVCSQNAQRGSDSEKIHCFLYIRMGGMGDKNP